MVGWVCWFVYACVAGRYLRLVSGPKEGVVERFYELMANFTEFVTVTSSDQSLFEAT